jgi:hypothetical protein
VSDSPLRSDEDLLGLTEGGDDGHGHLGFAGTPPRNWRLSAFQNVLFGVFI